MALQQQTAPAPSLLRAPGIPPLATEDFDDVDDFHDAAEEQPTCNMDLLTSLDECEVAIRKFFCNDLDGAMSVMKPWCQTSLYHSLGTAIFEFIPAMLTFDHAQIDSALAALKSCINLCNQQRKNYTLVESLGTIIKKTDYNTYSDLEAHAELCYAEALLLQAAMTIIEGEDLTGFIRATLKVKSCYNTYKECGKILEKKQWECAIARVHFESGVKLGIAMFNLMISLLPPKIISLLEFVGFSGNKALGLAGLQAGSRAPGIRSILCDLSLLGYHLVICHFIGAQGDLNVCEEILDKLLTMYPNSVWFLIFKGRLDLLRGLFISAMHSYDCAISAQHTWQQFRHLCYWEVMWTNGLIVEWRLAAFYADKLIEESTWSRTIYSYTKAVLLLELGEKISVNERMQCAELLRIAPNFKQRIAGKSLPMEKFVIKRCARYQAQGGQLVLPAVELLCLWNMFHILSNNQDAAQNILKVIEKRRSIMEAGSQTWMAGYDADNRALICYLHGCCLRAMRLPRLALDKLKSVMFLKNDIREDTFLVPYSVAEMAMCHHDLGENEKAVQYLNEAKKKYSGYSLESRLHFRMHSALQIIKGNGNGKPASS